MSQEIITGSFVSNSYGSHLRDWWRFTLFGLPQSERILRYLLLPPSMRVQPKAWFYLAAVPWGNRRPETVIWEGGRLLQSAKLEFNRLPDNASQVLICVDNQTNPTWTLVFYSRIFTPEEFKRYV